MSIIHEALKKAAGIKKVAGPADAQKEVQSVTLDNIERKTTPKKQHALILPIALSLMAILVISSVFLLSRYAKNFGFKISNLPTIKKPQVAQPANNRSRHLPKSIAGRVAVGNVTPIPQEEIQPVIADTPKDANGPLDSFVLTGVAYSDTEPMAIINGSVYTEGESVKGAKIIKITEQEVLLEKEGKKIQLTVK